MLNTIVVSIRFILLVLGGQKQVAFENAALHQQLAVFKRNVPRPKLNNRDRLFLDRPVHDLAGLEIRVDIREARNRNVLASQAVQAVEVIPTETTRPSTNLLGNPETHPNDGHRQSNMGSATGTWRTEKAGIQDFGTDRVAPDAEEDRKADTDLDDVSAKSRWPNGLGRFLHGPDVTTPRTLCLRRPRT
jgi:hypothetical protein